MTAQVTNHERWLCEARRQQLRALMWTITISHCDAVLLCMALLACLWSHMLFAMPVLRVCEICAQAQGRQPALWLTRQGALQAHLT